jgi:hypothetical protein
MGAFWHPIGPRYGTFLVRVEDAAQGAVTQMVAAPVVHCSSSEAAKNL